MMIRVAYDDDDDDDDDQDDDDDDDDDGDDDDDDARGSNYLMRVQVGLPSSQLDHPLFITYMLLFELKCTVHYIHATMGTAITCTKHYMLLFALHCTVNNLQCTEHKLGALHWEERFAPVHCSAESEALHIQEIQCTIAQYSIAIQWNSAELICKEMRPLSIYLWATLKCAPQHSEICI